MQALLPSTPHGMNLSIPDAAYLRLSLHTGTRGLTLATNLDGRGSRPESPAKSRAENRAQDRRQPMQQPCTFGWACIKSSSQKAAGQGTREHAGGKQGKQEKQILTMVKTRNA